VNRHHGGENDAVLRIARIIERTDVLGPGRRAAVVVQGCHLRCHGCIAEATHPLGAGTEVGVDDLFARLGAIDDIAGVTFSGGEPFLQAPALCRLIDLLRSARPRLSTMSYSGYRIEWLWRKGSTGQRDLLRRLDLLVDGPYVKRQHAPLRWRGSRNQRLLALSPRHRSELAREADAPAGIELSLDREMRLEWVGVPPVPDFAPRLAAATTVPEEA